MYHAHSDCRACGFASPGPGGIKSARKQTLIPVFNLGLQPLANDFAGPSEERSGFAPLEVLFCPNCTLPQLSVTVRPDILYRHYSYVTSTSDTMQEHFEKLFAVAQHESKGKRMLEIGSNDGLMLRFFSERGYSVCGIDPAENLAKVACCSGQRTVVGVFDKATATEAAKDGPFDMVIARHVFCHVDNWKDFIHCLNIVTTPQSLVCIEVPYVCDMLERGEFDTIYHEHTSYMNLRAIVALLEHSSYFLYDAVHYPIHGGAVLLMLRHRQSGMAGSDKLQSWLLNERAGLSDWERFAAKARENIEALKLFVREQVAAGNTVCGFGASAKSTVWVNACGFTRKDIRFITDTTMLKQWKLSPGTDIPVTDEGAILRELPDYAIVFCWNFLSEVLRKNELARSKGVKFVVPIPSLEVV